MTNRWHTTICSLLYPAFLGNMMYTGLEEWDKGNISFSSTSVTILLYTALIIHFVMDYLYTLSEDTSEKYGLLKFVIDILIVGCLYLATKATLHLATKATLPRTETAWTLWSVPTFMLITKGLALFWEAYDQYKKDQTKRGVIGTGYKLITDLFFIFVYCAYVFFLPVDIKIYPWCLTLIVFVDAGTYAFYHVKSVEWKGKGCNKKLQDRLNSIFSPVDKLISILFPCR